MRLVFVWACVVLDFEAGHGGADEGTGCSSVGQDTLAYTHLFAMVSAAT